MKNSIRPMTLKDLEKVMVIEEACFEESWTRESFVYEIFINKVAQYFVYELDKKVVGYIGVWLLEDEVHITNLAVAPLFRKKKVATNLLEFILDYSQKLKYSKLSLEVRKNNKKAIQLYKKFEFNQKKVLNGYYKGEDGVLMQKLLE